MGRAPGRGVLPGAGAKLVAADLEKCWQALADGDAKTGQEAVGKLATHPDLAVPFFNKKLSPVPNVTAKELQALIEQLGAKQFRTREQATAKLKQLGGQVGPALRQALTAKPPLEMKRRIEKLLDALPPRDVNLPPGDALRALRAVQALEAMATPAATALLQRLAGGAPDGAPDARRPRVLARLRK